MTVAAGPEQAWHRLHPLTPLLRGGRGVLLAVALIGQQGLRESPVIASLVLLLGVLPLAVLLGWLSWRAMRYRVTPTELQVDSGILVKRSRRVPLARVQAVDVVRPFYARVLGVAELRLEVVGSGKAEAPLAFLAEEDADGLRTRLLDLASGRQPAVEGELAEPAPADRVLVTVPTGPLVWSTLLTVPVLALAVALVAFIGTALVEPRAIAPLALTLSGLVVGTGSYALRRILSEYDFSVAESPDGLRLRHGLLDTRSQTIPAGRVQGLRITEPLLWRRAGWVRLEVDVAGYSAGGDQQTSTGVLLPVAPRQLAHDLAARVLGGPLPAADRRAPRAARVRAPLQFRRLAVGLDERHVVSTSGVLTTTTDIAPLAKVQSLRRTTGPWQRRLGLASLHVDTAGRRLPGATLRHRSAVEADALLEQLDALARAAR